MLDSNCKCLQVQHHRPVVVAGLLFCQDEICRPHAFQRGSIRMHACCHHLVQLCCSLSPSVRNTTLCDPKSNHFARVTLAAQRWIMHSRDAAQPAGGEPGLRSHQFVLLFPSQEMLVGSSEDNGQGVLIEPMVREGSPKARFCKINNCRCFHCIMLFTKELAIQTRM